ncbi:MAG: SpoIIE family protein phosphatase [Bacteroidota bacterium]
MRKLFTIAIFFSCILSFSQRSILDSLKQQVKIHQTEDTTRAYYLTELAWQYLDYSTDSAGIYSKAGLILSDKLNYINGVIAAKSVDGLLYRISNQPDMAIKTGKEVIELRLKYGPPTKLTGAYSNLGSAYIVKGDNANALNYLNKALENAQQWKQIENQILILANIGIVYENSELNDLALETFQKAVVINKQLSGENREIQQAQLYTNIASLYHKRKWFKEAYKYYKYAYGKYKKDDNIRQMSIVAYNLTSTTRQLHDLKSCQYFLSEMRSISEQLKEDEYTATFYLANSNYLLEVNRYEEALIEVNQGLALVDTVNSLETYSILLGIKSDCYRYLKEYKKALELADQGLRVILKTDHKGEISSIYYSKSEIYKGLNDFKMALYYYGKAVENKDSINNESFDTRIATLNSFNQLDRKEKELELSNKEKEKVSSENKRQTTLLIAGSIVGILVLIFLIFSVRAYKIKQKDNVLLSESKKEIEHQKEMVDEKQKEIVDSINYALQIQKTLIANHDFVNQTIPDSFVFFQPKDIVSGDFYWATKKDKRFYLAVCDSTGHGVPGAFMSLLNINYLNEAIKEKNILKPNEVFDHVRKRLIETISQNGRQDGMDGVLICIEDGSNVISYAAANNAPVLISGDRLSELKCDKMPVGIGEKTESFTEFSFEVKKGDVLYLYTDGYADQFGGPQGKKFKYKQLDTILKDTYKLPVEEQEAILREKFEKWKGTLEQVDDVCILGIRI